MSKLFLIIFTSVFIGITAIVPLSIGVTLHFILPCFKKGQQWLCSHGFHSSVEDGEVTGFNGISFKVKCGRCGKECLVDSQGNLF